jgi:hypothetical protein
MKKLKHLLLTGILGLALASPAATASAHGLTVVPPTGETKVNQVVSTDWAQAHCHAQAPATATDKSGGVVTFTPAGAFPCPTGPGQGAPGR